MRIKLQHQKHTEYVGHGAIPDDAVEVVDTEHFYFEIQADGNFETLATSEIYNSKGAALHAIGLILNNRNDDSFVDATADR